MEGFGAERPDDEEGSTEEGEAEELRKGKRGEEKGLDDNSGFSKGDEVKA